LGITHLHVGFSQPEMCIEKARVDLDGIFKFQLGTFVFTVIEVSLAFLKMGLFFFIVRGAAGYDDGHQEDGDEEFF